jgi:multiple sugar transport system permease protein
MAAVTRRPNAGPRLWWRIKYHRFAYLLILPTLIGMLLVHFIPTVQGIWMSFLKLNQFTLGRFLRAPFIGLDNYKLIIADPNNPVVSGITLAARNTLIYSIFVNAGALGIGIVAALLLNRRFRGRGIARTLILLPWVVPTYAVGMLWGMMWLRDRGIINMILVNWLHLLGHKPFWLIGPNTIWAIIIPTIWRQLPFNTVMLLSGLQIVPGELYEAAEIDGASGWQKFWRITLPLMKPVISILLLWGVIFTVFGYNIVVMMFGNGGGYPGEWGDLLMPAIQRQSFGYWLFGLGAAASTLMMLGMMVFVAGWYRVFRTSLTEE